MNGSGRLVFLYLFFALGIAAPFRVKAQNLSIIKGKVTYLGEPISYTSIVLNDSSKGFTANGFGEFRIKLKPDVNHKLTFSRVGFKSMVKKVTLKVGETLVLNLELIPDQTAIEQVEVIGKDEKREQVGVFAIDAKLAKVQPSPFGDFSRLLTSLPGVVSNNELSSSYSVRGGSFDENLVYVNDIEIYRPFLVRAGQQEGLSFVNPDLVQSVDFYTGGWQSRFGDKLSSVLNVKYKEPEQIRASATIGLLFRSLSFEGSTKNKRFTWVAGMRQKTARYFLGASNIFKGLAVRGEYFPLFTDGQAYFTYDLTSRKDSVQMPRKTVLGLLISGASNQYSLIPTTRENSFGTFTNTLRITAAFDGEESMTYQTYQVGLRLSHKWNKLWKTDVTISGVNTAERERIDLESGYRLCDVQTDRSKSNFNECIFERAIGTEYQYARNRLRANVVNLLNRNYFRPNEHREVEFGFGAAMEQISDNLYEYGFVDSADYVRVRPAVTTENSLNSQRVNGYLQQSHYFDKYNQSLTYGIRFNHWTLNGETIISPRIQYSFKPNWKKDWRFKVSSGVFQQPAFYREMRNKSGNVNIDLRAQRSVQLVLGADHSFMMWGREFRFWSEAYGKYMDRVVPYDVENVRLRYFATNSATAFATGADFRVSGEFIKGAESWFSLGVLSTREDVDGDGKGYIKRPTDQRVTFNMFFQDHLPNNPSARAYVQMTVGTGLPFGPPDNLPNRNLFKAPPYRRLDIGFSKVVSLEDRSTRVSRIFKQIWIGLEILNVTGTENVISYNWIKDVNNTQFAIPNTLSSRFLNLRLMLDF